MLSFVIQCIIGNQNLWLSLWTLFTLCLCGVLFLIKSVGSQQRVKILRCEDIIILYHLTVVSFPWKMMWQSKVFPRIFFFFSCSASLDNITTTDNIQKKQIIVVNWCYVCKRCGELADHFLLHSPIAYELWSLVFCLFGIHWIMQHWVIELFDFCGRVSLVLIAIQLYLEAYAALLDVVYLARTECQNP